MKKILLIAGLVLIMFTKSNGQSVSSSVVATAGATYSSSSGSMSFTMGESVIQFYNTGENSFSCGFQQNAHPLLKHLMLILYLEGLYNGHGMNNSQNASGNAFSVAVADEITVQLQQSTAPYEPISSCTDVDLSTNGLVQCEIPGHLNDNYYIVVKNRNHLETWSASPISFAGTHMSYNFTDAAAKAFGNKLKVLGEGVFGLFAGDANQDGLINGADIDMISTAAQQFTTGYVSPDINGDGMVDAIDLILTDNNAAAGVEAAFP